MVKNRYKIYMADTHQWFYEAATIEDAACSVALITARLPANSVVKIELDNPQKSFADWLVEKEACELKRPTICCCCVRSGHEKL